MRAPVLLALALLSPLAVAAPAGGHALGTWTWGSAGEITSVPPQVGPDGLQPSSVVFAQIELPEGASGVYAKLTAERLAGVRVDRGFAIFLSPPSGAQWSVVTPHTLAVAHCPDLALACAHEPGDSPHAQSTPVLPAAPGTWQLRAYGSTNGAWDVTIFST